MSCQAPVISIARFATVLIDQSPIKNQPIFLLMIHLFIGTMVSSAKSVKSRVMAETINVPLTCMWYGSYCIGLSGCFAFFLFAVLMVWYAPPRPIPSNMFNRGPPKQADLCNISKITSIRVW